MKFLTYVLALAVALATFIPDADAGRRKRRKGSSVPYALRGGEAAQKRHNRAATAENLTRLDDRADLERFIAQGHLVEISDTGSYYLDTVGGHDPGHERLYRYARPWTKRFLDAELAAGHAKFGHRFKVTSLVRTNAYQRRICRSGNGAAICGGDWWEQSLHLTGATVDISKEGMSRKTLAWMRKRLVALQTQGKVAAIEERGAFHVFVRKAYGAPAKKAKKPRKALKKARHRKARR
jgi:hypothetical protein